MQLTSFRVTNFRSVFDSGDIKIAQITALLGRNESGKSNLLKALASINPAGGTQPYSKIKDFPRSKALQECKADTPVVRTTWTLSKEEQERLEEIFPRAKNLANITIGRDYGPEGDTDRIYLFKGLADLGYKPKEIEARVRKLIPQLNALLTKLDEAKSAVLKTAITSFEEAVKVESSAVDWSSKAVTACSKIRTALAVAEQTLKNEDELLEIEALAADINADPKRMQSAMEYIGGLIPVFVYLDDYPSLNGHQNIAEFLQRKSNGSRNEADKSFEKLCKVAGLDPKQLQDLMNSNDAETRNQLANRSSSTVTQEIRRLWKDRALKIRFNLDAQHMDTFISDPNAVYDVEINLNERSRGFQWFFSFYITFAADTAGFKDGAAMLLLDEPGLYLHAKSQKDLLVHFKDFKNTILYTTHSPFMVPTAELDSIRTVNIDEMSGTTVTNDPSGDSRTLFPLQAALGYDLTQTLFVGPNSLVVEGVTDFWILGAVSNYLESVNKTALSAELTITPAGGAQKVSYMVALLTSEELNVLVLLDQEKQSNATKDDLVKNKLISSSNVIFVSEAMSNVSAESDIEDLLDPIVYDALVKESYSKELQGINLVLNPNIPRIAKRFEAAFSDAGLAFHKTRPTRLFLNKMASDPAVVMPNSSIIQFEKLFDIINKKLQTHLAKGSKPFNS